MSGGGGRWDLAGESLGSTHRTSASEGMPVTSRIFSSWFIVDVPAILGK